MGRAFDGGKKEVLMWGVGASDGVWQGAAREGEEGGRRYDI